MALTKPREERKLPAREKKAFQGTEASVGKARGAQAEGTGAKMEKARPCRTFQNMVKTLHLS